MLKTGTISSLAFLLSVLGTSACSTFRPLDISERPLEDKDLALDWSKTVNRDKDDFSEQARLDGVLEDGGRLSVRLLVSNIAKLDGRAELLTHVTLGDGRVFTSTVRRDRGEWTASSERLEATIGGNTLSARVGAASARIEGEGFTLELEVESLNRALRPRGGGLEFGGTYYGTTVPIPRGVLRGRLIVKGAVAVAAEEEEAIGDEGENTASRDTLPPADSTSTATLATDDEEEIDLEGIAYVEHRATDLAPYRMAKRWYKLKEVTAERTVIVSIFERTPELGGELQGFVLIADDEGLRAYEPALVVTPKSLHTDPETGYTIPGQLFLKGIDDPSFEAVIRPRELTERRDDLAKMKALERVIVKRFMKPFTFIYEGSDYLFRRVPKSDAPEPSDEDATPEPPEYEAWAGRARFEIQQLNPD
jgi:hypothetical protein